MEILSQIHNNNKKVKQLLLFMFHLLQYSDSISVASSPHQPIIFSSAVKAPTEKKFQRHMGASALRSHMKNKDATEQEKQLCSVQDIACRATGKNERHTNTQSHPKWEMNSCTQLDTSVQLSSVLTLLFSVPSGKSVILSTCLYSRTRKEVQLYL